MAAKWNEVQFREVCEHSAFGPRFSSAEYAPDGNVATRRTTDISADGRIEYQTMPIAKLDLSRFEQHLLKKDDLVITRSGRVGTTAVFSQHTLPVLPGAFLIRFRLKREIADPLFYRYFFNSPLGQELLASVATGSVQQNLNITSLHGLRVPNPPLHEQHSIAAVLEAFDKKIELNRQTNETLESLAQNIFKSWFVNSTQAGLPTGWRESTLGELIELAYGKALKEEERKPGRVAVFGSNGQVGWHDQKLVDGPGIVVGRKGNAGTVTWSPTDFYPIDTTFYVVPKGECHSIYFLFYALRAHDLPSLGADSAVPGLNRNMVYMSEQILPPAGLLEKFDAIVKPLFERIHANDEQSRTLAALRDALLPKLLSGDLRVSSDRDCR
jgi:type I restriction enzyme, S subunit